MDMFIEIWLPLLLLPVMLLSFVLIVTLEKDHSL